MARTAVVSSRGAKIQLSLPDQGDAAPRILMAACGGGAGLLAKVSVPVAEMQLRGFGQSRVDADSASTTGVFNLSGYMNDFDATLQQADMEKSVLLGYSHSGYFTTMYALRNPDKVAAMILIEPALFTDRADLEQRAKLAEQGDSIGAIQAMLSYVDRETGLDEDKSIKVAKAITDQAQSSVTIAREFRIRANNPISERELSELKMPILLVGGTESRVADMVVKAAACIPYANVFWVRGASHLDLLYNGNQKFGDQISGAINAFMATLR
jgi:pimeloyl-ACP methyl ester carboxylesterase